MVSAEVVPGPGGELIPLRIGDRLSISHDVQFGLLSLPSKALMVVWGMLVVCAIVGVAVRFMEDDTPEAVKKGTYVVVGLVMLTTPLVIVGMIRIRRISRRLIANLPRDPADQKTPGPSL